MKHVSKRKLQKNKYYLMYWYHKSRKNPDIGYDRIAPNTMVNVIKINHDDVYKARVGYGLSIIKKYSPSIYEENITYYWNLCETPSHNGYFYELNQDELINVLMETV